MCGLSFDRFDCKYVHLHCLMHISIYVFLFYYRNLDPKLCTILRIGNIFILKIDENLLIHIR